MARAGLINVTPKDPLGYVVAGILGVVALAATWIPAWAASPVDQPIALRDE